MSYKKQKVKFFKDDKKRTRKIGNGTCNKTSKSIHPSRTSAASAHDKRLSMRQNKNKIVVGEQAVLIDTFWSNRGKRVPVKVHSINGTKATIEVLIDGYSLAKKGEKMQVHVGNLEATVLPEKTKAQLIAEHKKKMILPAKSARSLRFRHNSTPHFGGGLAGYIKGATYWDLVQKFGYPQLGSPDGKTQANWELKDSNGHEITIYDWKKYNTPVEEVTDWNVGGNRAALSELKIDFKTYKHVTISED
jgi:hypothetical protein